MTASLYQSGSAMSPRRGATRGARLLTFRPPRWTGCQSPACLGRACPVVADDRVRSRRDKRSCEASVAFREPLVKPARAVALGVGEKRLELVAMGVRVTLSQNEQLV